MNESKAAKYPLLEPILASRNLPLQPMYSNHDVAQIFDVCVRVIQNRIASGRLILWHANLNVTLKAYASCFDESSGVCAREAWLEEREARRVKPSDEGR